MILESRYIVDAKAETKEITKAARMTRDARQGLSRMVKALEVGFLATWLLALSVPGLARAAPGRLDPTFGPGGTVTTKIGVAGSGSAVALQPDGKIIVAGVAESPVPIPPNQRSVARFALARYTSTGGLDPTFGTGGTVTTDFGDLAFAFASAVALQPDGKIVVVGGAGNPGTFSFALARYLPDGGIDLTFGSGGKVTTDFGADPLSGASALAMQSDGKIVLAGRTGDVSVSNFALARYRPDGGLDFTFGANGKVTTDFGADDSASAVAVQPDGRIVVAGSTGIFPGIFPSGGYDFALARYTPDGTLDPTFGSGGRITTDFGGSDVAQALALQADGKIVAAGSNNAAFALARYIANGSLDPTFGTGGKVTTDFGAASAVAIQPDGKIVASGGSPFALARYEPTGNLDLGFGVGGRVTTDFSDFFEGRAMALQLDGKIVVAGGARNPFSSGQDNFALARYNSNGSPDLTFRGEGKVTTDFGAASASASAVAVQPDGKIVVAGERSSVFGVQTTAFALARYHPDGRLDLGFGTGGKVTTSFGDDAFAFPLALALQGDGKFVAAGGVSAATGLRGFALARYNADGSLDPAFGTGGKVVTELGENSYAAALALQPDGKIVVAGSSFDSGGGHFTVARYNPDGGLDVTFGTGGKVITDFGYNDAASAVGLQPDGRIVVAGGTVSSGNVTFALARYGANGSLDPTFGTGGKVTTDFGHGEVAFALALQPDGKIVVAGGSFVGVGDFALARYSPDGNLDPTFGTGGKVTADFGGADAAAALALQPDGKIVVTVFIPGNIRTPLARYTSEGSLDPTFGIGGKVDADFTPALAIQPDGRILVAGTSDPFGRYFAVARYTGDLPTTFIATNQLEYHAGDLMTVAITTDPGLSTEPRYLVVALMTPDSTPGNPFFIYRFAPVVELLTFQDAGARSLADVAARPVSVVTAESFTILGVTVPALPAGSYQWLTALLSEDFSVISNVATATFDLLP